MAESDIRYCTTEDGVRIAYCVEGGGAPFVWIPGSTQAGRLIGGAMGTPVWLVKRWARAFRIVRYDARGFGLSAQAEADLSLEARLRDLDAVVAAAAGDDPVILRGMSDAAGVAIAFAATRSSRVRALLLFGAFASGSELAALRPGMHDALLELLKAEPSLGTKALHTLLAGQALPGTDESTVSVGEASLIVDGIRCLDVREYLRDVAAPTLVIHGRADTLVPIKLGRAVAAAIPNARLYEYEGPHTPPNQQIVDEVSAVVGEFLGVDVQQQLMPSPAAQVTFRTVLFTDLVGHTEMMRRLGDERGRAVLREHERITRDVLREYGGAEVKTMGDGFMASFGSVTSAMDCAIALQRAFAGDLTPGRLRGDPSASPSGGEGSLKLDVRIGLNAGEPIEEDGDLFGSTVIMASRIAGQAEAGEILIPEPLRHLLSGKSYAYADRGETMLKGFEDAVRLYEVRWRE